MHQEASNSRMVISMAIILLLLFSGLSCAIVDSRTLEFKHVLLYKLDINPETNTPEKISGACGESAYCVQSINSETNGTVLVVLVKIGFCKDGQTGGFSYPLKISNDINELRFGTNEDLLWKRQ